MERRLIVLVILSMVCFGCATPSAVPPENKEILSSQPRFPDYKLSREEGSLWSEMTGIALYPDMRARKIGDIVVVRITEDPEADLSTSTSTGRKSGIGAQLKFMGLMKMLDDQNPKLNLSPDDEIIKAALESSFDGNGSSNRDGHMRAFISVVVENVLPNGYLFIKGERKIKVNNETQFITISGIIRPEDIEPSNEISSTYVADARIAYSGNGILADKQRPGWLGRIVDYVWPF